MMLDKFLLNLPDFRMILIIII